MDLMKITDFLSILYSRVRNRRRAGNKRKAQTENVSRPWKKLEKLINIGPLIRP